MPYSKTHYFEGYREDCSGYVSMAWGLPGPGAVTSTMHNYGHRITKRRLRPGDALLNSGDHVLMFQKWANSAHTA